MVSDLNRKLIDREELSGIFCGPDPYDTPLLSKYLALNPRTTKLAFAVVTYHPARSPEWLRQILLRYSHYEDGTYVHIDATGCDANGFSELENSNGGGSGSSGGEINRAEMKQVDDLTRNLDVLENNGQLRLHSDFVILQTRNQTRVYPLDSLPENVKAVRDFISSRKAKIRSEFSVNGK